MVTYQRITIVSCWVVRFEEDLYQLSVEVLDQTLLDSDRIEKEGKRIRR